MQKEKKLSAGRASGKPSSTGRSNVAAPGMVPGDSRRIVPAEYCPPPDGSRCSDHHPLTFCVTTGSLCRRPQLENRARYVVLLCNSRSSSRISCNDLSLDVRQIAIDTSAATIVRAPRIYAQDSNSALVVTRPANPNNATTKKANASNEWRIC